MEKSSKNSEKTLSISAKNTSTSTSPMATLAIGLSGFIDLPITTKKPSGYRINDLNTLMNSVVHKHRLELTEPFFSISSYQTSNQFFRSIKTRSIKNQSLALLSVMDNRLKK